MTSIWTTLDFGIVTFSYQTMLLNPEVRLKYTICSIFNCYLSSQEEDWAGNTMHLLVLDKDEDKCQLSRVSTKNKYELLVNSNYTSFKDYSIGHCKKFLYTLIGLIWFKGCVISKFSCLYMVKRKSVEYNKSRTYFINLPRSFDWTFIGYQAWRNVHGKPLAYTNWALKYPADQFLSLWNVLLQIRLWKL